MALALHEAAFGPPPFGKDYRCFSLSGGGAGPYGYVYCIGVAATYLVQTIHERVGAAPVTDDVEVTTTHWRWDGAGDPAESDFEIVTDRLDSFWDALNPYRVNSISIREHRWYPAVVPPASPGPAILVTSSIVGPGGGSGVLPPQVASTITFITDVRRRWGRFYIGGINSLQNTTSGRVAADFVSGVADAGEAAFANTAANWKIQVFGAPTPNSLPVRQVRVDDVFDIIRSRRYGGALQRETRDLD